MQTINDAKLKTLSNIAKTGFTLMIIGFLFAITETIYFWSYLPPESKNEMICDRVSLYITGSGSLLMMYSIITKTIIDIKNVLK